MTQDRLDSYGVDYDKPVLVKDSKVSPIHTESRGTITPGYRGMIPYRNSYGFLRFCDRAGHYNDDVDGSVLIEKVKQHLASRGVETVLIAEEDTGAVYEYHIGQFDQRVPKTAKRGDAKDEPQLYAPSDHYYGKFEDHVEAVLATGREDSQ